MVDTSLIENFMYQNFNIPSTQMWYAIAGAIMASAIIFFFMKIIFDTILGDKNSEYNSLTTGVSLVFSIAAIIYILYSGMWAVLATSMWIFVLMGLLVIFFVFGRLVKRHAPKIRSGKKLVKGRKEREEIHELKEARGEDVEDIEDDLNKEYERDINKEAYLYNQIEKLINEIKELEKNQNVDKEKFKELSEKIDKLLNESEILEKENKLEFRDEKAVEDARGAKIDKKRMQHLNEAIDELKKSRDEVKHKKLNVVLRHLSNAAESIAVTIRLNRFSIWNIKRIKEWQYKRFRKHLAYLTSIYIAVQHMIETINTNLPAETRRDEVIYHIDSLLKNYMRLDLGLISKYLPKSERSKVGEIKEYVKDIHKCRKNLAKLRAVEEISSTLNKCNKKMKELRDVLVEVTNGVNGYRI